MVQDILKNVHDKGQGTGPRTKSGQVLYMRGAMSAMLAVEGIKPRTGTLRQGQGHDGRTGALGLENLALDQKKLDALGFAGVMRPISTSCADHMGSTWARVHTWDGKASGTSRPTGCRPMSRSSSRWSSPPQPSTLADKKLTRRARRTARLPIPLIRVRRLPLGSLSSACGKADSHQPGGAPVALVPRLQPFQAPGT